VNLTNTTQGGADTGIVTKTGTSGQKEYILWYQAGGDKKFHFFCSADGTTTSNAIWPTSPTANTWYNISGGWEGSNVWISVNAAARVTTAFTGPLHQPALQRRSRTSVLILRNRVFYPDTYPPLQSLVQL
jgi:hypothetical protein